ncbi:MAG: hypothetical protein LBL72_01000 [Candidatus Accumulibacter sp.]|jgi:heme exporter protein D|nr:hypothetical protein [Accumulibacter sp.]
MASSNFCIFIAFGKYNVHVFAALFVTLLFMTLEPFLLSRRRRRILSDLRKRLRAPASAASAEFSETSPQE